MEKAPTVALSWLKGLTSTFTSRNLLIYATQRALGLKRKVWSQQEEDSMILIVNCPDKWAGAGMVLIQSGSNYRWT